MNQHTSKELYNRIENLIPEIKIILDAKKTLTEIAKHFNFSKDSLCNYLDKKGIRKKRQRKIYFSKAQKISEYIYKGSNKEIRLERKYKKYKEYCRLRSTSKRRS